MREWIPCDERMPKRYQNVWVTYKDKTVMAYLDTEREPRWHDIKSGKSYPYQNADAWMGIEVPAPYKKEYA